MTPQDFQKVFQPKLAHRLEGFLRACDERVSDPFLRKMLRYSSELVLHGGKRLRPYVAYQMYLSCGGRASSGAIETCVALELFHHFALLQDDVMDEGTMRHGMNTLHVWAVAELKKAYRRGNLSRIADSMAILVGDLYLNEAFRILEASKTIPDARRSAVKTLLTEMCTDVMCGQLLDIDLTSRMTATRAQVMQKMMYKTATYTFVKPMKIGCAMAGGIVRDMQFCEAYGVPVGLAFQIQDDLLDVRATAENVGKGTLSDYREGQHTLLTRHVMQHGSVRERALFLRTFGAPISPSLVPRVRQLFEATGALVVAQQEIDRYLEEGRVALDQWKKRPEGREAFTALMTYLVKRSS